MPDNIIPTPPPSGDDTPQKKRGFFNVFGGSGEIPTTPSDPLPTPLLHTDTPASTAPTPKTPTLPEATIPTPSPSQPAIDEVIITPDDGPVEHVRESDTKPTTTPTPASSSPIAAALAWQGSLPPQAKPAPIPTPTLTSVPSSVGEIKKTPTKIPEVISTPPVPVIEIPQPPATATHTGTRSIRTFKDDVEQVVTRRQVSVVGAIAAEENRRTHQDTPDGQYAERSGGRLSPTMYFILGMSLALFVIGGTAIGIAFYFSSPPASVLPANEIPSYITAEEQVPLKTDGLARSALMSTLIKAQQDLNTKIGSITQIYFTKTIVDPIKNKPVAALLPTDEFFKVFELHAPDALVRSLDPKMMFGFHQFDQVRPFIILKTTSYEIAFAAMIDWERDLNADLAPLFGPIVTQQLPRPLPEENNETSDATTSSSTPMATSTAPTKQKPPTTALFVPHTFEDAVIKNKDVRLLRDSEGNIAVVYGFYDKQTILIANDENTFKEVVTRLSSRRF